MKKRYKLSLHPKILFLSFFVISTFTSCSSSQNIKRQNNNVILGNNAKFMHFDGYYVDYEVIIFDVKEAGKDTWEVKFNEKQNKSDQAYSDGYSFATVVKQKDGTFQGNIIFIYPKEVERLAKTCTYSLQPLGRHMKILLLKLNGVTLRNWVV